MDVREYRQYIKCAFLCQSVLWQVGRRRGGKDGRREGIEIQGEGSYFRFWTETFSCLFIGQVLESGRSINHNYQIVEPPLSNRNLHLSSYRYAIAGMLDGRALYSRMDTTTVSLSRY